MSSRKRKGSIWRMVLSMIGIMIGIMVCTASLVVATDFYCYSDINHWTPIYPDAELDESRREGFFRARGMGITEQVYYSPDDPVEVRAWFREYRREITSGNYNNRNANSAVRGYATASYRISDGDDGGTRIYYIAECAYN